MPTLNLIFDSGQRLVRRVASSTDGMFNTTDLQTTSNITTDFQSTAVPSISPLSTLDITASASAAPADANHTTATPNYSTGLAGVNLKLDVTFVQLIWVSMVGVGLIVLALRLWQLCSAHIRHIYCLHADRTQQNYWSYDKTWWWPWLKREVIYAPLGKKRHNREIQLSHAANYGTLPGRVHAFLLTCYALTNVVYLLVLPYGIDTGQLIAELRGRAGMLSTVNLIPLVLMAGRNNPAIALLNISFDTFNLFHRWIGRIVICEATIHVCAWYANYRVYNSSPTFYETFSNNPFLTSGLCAMIAMSIILFQSLSAIRHAFYETFLHLHIILALSAILGVYIHLELHQLPALPYIRIVVFFWIFERLMRVTRLIYLNCHWRRGMTYVTVEALPAEACRVTFQLPRHITVRPGSHIYAYLPRISWWQSHPFSVAWTNIESEPATGYVPEAESFLSSGGQDDDDDDSTKDLEKQDKSSIGNLATAPTAISLIVSARTGMTRKLYEQAQKATLQIGGFVEGPYAGHDCLSSYGTVVMFAGGAGITHHLVQIRHLVARAQAKTVATRKIVLVWTVRDLDALSWIRTWMNEILRMPGRKDILTLELYVTRPRGAADYASPNSTILLYPRRCDPGTVLDRVLPVRVGAVMVTICGPGAFADEVRAAVRSRLHIGNIDMNEEAFTW